MKIEKSIPNDNDILTELTKQSKAFLDIPNSKF